MTRTGMGACVHFLSVFLVFEHDGDILGMVQEFWVVVCKYSPRGCTENETSHSYSLGSS